MISRYSCVETRAIPGSSHVVILIVVILLSFINPRPTKGVVTILTVCLRPHKNAKESDPRHLRHLFYILCGHFDVKKNRGYPPKMGIG